MVVGGKCNAERHRHRNLFHFERVDVLAATDDDVLEAADDAQVAARVEQAEIARVVVAIGRQHLEMCRGRGGQWPMRHVRRTEQSAPRARPPRRSSS